MRLSFRVKSMLRNRRWKKYWVEQENRNHIEFYMTLAREWRAR